MNIFPYHIIDLTHALDTKVPTWDGQCGFTTTVKSDYSAFAEDVKFKIQNISMHAGIGTHIDSPAHCIPSGITVEGLSLQHLIAPCVVINISAQATSTYSLQPDDILKFEKEYEKIIEGAFVIVYTGWEQYWTVPPSYHNNYMFPSVSLEAAKLLLERNIVGLGIDTLSPDRPTDGFQVHQLLLGNGKYIIENIANAQQLPAVGSLILALPIKAAGLTEAPIRLIGLVGYKNKN